MCSSSVRRAVIGNLPQIFQEVHQKIRLVKNNLKIIAMLKRFVVNHMNRLTSEISKQIRIKKFEFKKSATLLKSTTRSNSFLLLPSKYGHKRP